VRACVRARACAR